MTHLDSLAKRWAIAGLLSLWTATTLAANPGDEVILLYNTRMSESKAVAEYYAQKRQVPKSQIIGLELTTNEEMWRADFQNQLQKPLVAKLEAAKLWRFGSAEIMDTNGKPVRVEGRLLESKIRYLVPCYGVPVRITPDATVKEPGDDKLQPELRRNGAAVDSELTLLPLIKQKVPLNGPFLNPLYGTTNATLLHPTNGILLVSRLDGPTDAIARGLVDKALEAESNGFWGRAYVDLRRATEVPLKTGDDWMKATAEFCTHAGFETIVDTNYSTFPVGYPMSHIAFYAGWYNEHVIGPFAEPKVEFMPGAFAYHLHSFSAGTLRRIDHQWVSPFLDRGVTCTMGTVDEPYLAGTPDIGTFAGRFLILGFSFGEAACASQSVLSWQTTVVGDPLYRPFLKPPQQLHKELEERKSPLIEWSHMRVVQLNLVRNSPLIEMSGYLEGIKETKSSAVLSEKLGDLYAGQGKPSSAAQLYEQALKLAPSPRQRTRIRFSLGETLVALNRDEDAFANYRKLIEENVNHPNKVPIYQRLAALANKMGKTEEAARWEGLVQMLTTKPGQ